MKFATHECPMCGNVLKLLKINGISSYKCVVGEPHYEVEFNSQIIVQKMYAFPFAIDNFNNFQRSRVYKWKNGKWDFITETTTVNPMPEPDLSLTLRFLTTNRLF